MSNAFRDGELRIAGTEIDKLLPPISRFGGGNRAKKKQTVIDKLKAFFEKYFGIGGPVYGLSVEKEEKDENQAMSLVAESRSKY